MKTDSDELLAYRYVNLAADAGWRKYRVAVSTSTFIDVIFLTSQTTAKRFNIQYTIGPLSFQLHVVHLYETFTDKSVR